MEEIQKMFNEAIKLHQIGKLNEAKELYEKILKINPNHRDTLHLLGLIFNSLNQKDKAVKFITKAISIKEHEVYYCNLGNIFKEQKRLEEAISMYEKAILINPNYADAYNNLGIVFYDQNKLNEAIGMYEKTILINPNYVDAYNNLGNVFKEKNRLDEAISVYEKAISLNPNYADAYYNLGNALKEQNKLNEAISMYEKVIAINPNYADAYNNFGVVLKEQNKLNEAISMYEKVIAINPNYADAYNNFGVVLKEQNKLNEAIGMYKKAISINPNYVKAYINLGVVLKEQNRLNEAINMYEKAIFLNPNYTDAYINLGVVFQEQNRLNEAIGMYEKAIDINPNYVEAYNNLGNILKEQNRLNEAIRMYEKVIAINPNYVEAYYNLGNVFKNQNKLDEAIGIYEKAIAINPRHIKAYNNFGVVFQEQNKLNEAIGMYEKAIAINPNYVEAYWNKSLTYLSKGDLKEGFELYEYRWLTKDFTSPKRNFTQPLWLGKESLDGKTILIHSEQGLGDILQFCRYISMVVKLNAKVIFEVEKPLLPLLKQIEGVVEFIIKGETLPFFDYHCPLLSLPLAFNTTLETIPPILLNIKINEEKINYWKNRFKDITKPKIGLVWNGNPEHKNDHNRSLSLEKLINFLPKEFEYISLQKEIRDEDKIVLENSNISFFGNELNDFEDTSALIQNVDLVVSVDTSVAHLAGTLNKKTFVLLPFSPDWRWMLNRDDSPWYPSVKLFRQKSIGDWDGIFEELNENINSFFML